MSLANNFEKVLLTFNACNVDYMIAGGYAVIFHGYGRTTGDLRDLIINKMLTGRLKDKADVEELQKIHRLKKKKR